MLRGRETHFVPIVCSDNLKYLALIDIRRAIKFCWQVNLTIICIVENMNGFICHYCSKTVDIFKSSGGKSMSLDMVVLFLEMIPLEPKVVDTGVSGSLILSITGIQRRQKHLMQKFMPSGV